MAATVITEHVTVGATTHEVRGKATGAWGEYLLQVLVRHNDNLTGWHLLAYIQKDTDRPQRLEWTVEDVNHVEIGLGYPTLRDAISRAGKRLIEKGA